MNKEKGNLEKAITHLKKIGFAVFKHPEKELYDIHKIGHKELCDSPYFNSTRNKNEPFDRNPREVIKFANIYSQNNNQNTAKKQSIKSSAKRVRKTTQQKAFNSKNFDKIDELPMIDPKHDDESFWD